MNEYKLKNAGLILKFDFPSVEANSLHLDNVDGPPMEINSHYMLVPGRSADGQIGGWMARVMDGGMDLAILDYLNRGGPNWSSPFYTRDYPFCWVWLENGGDMRYRVFTQRETDFPDLNPDNVPVYSQVGIYKASRIHSDQALQLAALSHWQDLKQCCYFDPTGVNKQPPAGLKGVVLVHAEPVNEEIVLLYYTRIIDIRVHNYDKQFPHGYPTYMTPRIEPPASGPGDWHRPNLCIAEYNTKTNKLTKYYNGEFDPGQDYDSGLLDRPAMYGRMIRYKDHLIYTAQSQGNKGIHVFTSSNRIDWDYECTIPIADAFHPCIMPMSEDGYVLYFCKDRDLKFTFGLRTVKMGIFDKNEETDVV